MPSLPTRPGYGLTWAKTILVGEHSVVYGHPAVALPLHDLRMEATARPVDGPPRLRSLGYDGPMDAAGARFACVVRAYQAARDAAGTSQDFEITTSSGFPYERGLGSSAAAAGAVIRAVLDACGREASAAELFELTQTAERVAHEHPSGLDARATCAPGPIRFQQGQMRPLRQRVEAVLVIADSGVQGSTREAVGGLRRRYDATPATIAPLVDRLGSLTETAIAALGAGDPARLGAAMDQAHQTLAELGLSLPVLDRLVDTARQAGALGAKLTGGGLGGCLIALTSDDHTDQVRQGLDQAGAAQTWTYQIRTSEDT